MKFALISQVLPPSGDGQSIVIGRLLSGVAAEDYCLIIQDYGRDKEHRKKDTGRLPGKYYYISPLWEFRHGWRFSLVRWANVISRALTIARTLKRERCMGIVACPGDFFDLPAAYIASRLANVGFYPYMLDYYSQQAVGFKGERFARKFESKMMRRATCVIATNEFIRDELHQRYGIKQAVIVRNPCDVSKYEALPPFQSNSQDEFKIVFTGNVYAAHSDAFRNLLAAIEMLNERSARKIALHLYTNKSSDELAENGIVGPIVLHKAQEANAMPSIQRQADVLFLPLAFSAPYPELIRTSAPAKTGEYLAASRPILVHAPPDSFLTWYFRKHDCGLVVDERDPTKLAQALETLLADKSRRDKLAANAWERAQLDFSIESSQAAFADLLKLKLPDEGGASRALGREK